ncbi:MAG: hypothetical protein JJT94_09070 [Bernardetiaceae bacterium]|nr:hypothetical protein [Bernardetiaceae bacterium]
MKIIAWIVGICLLPLSFLAQAQELQLYKKADKQVFAEVKNDFFIPLNAQKADFTYRIADKYDAKLVLGELEGNVQHIFVVPNQMGELIVEVFKDEQPYQNFTFEVVRAPKPDIQLRLGNKIANLGRGEKLEDLRDIYLYAEPNAVFAENAPQDAKYKVSEAKGTLVLGRSALTTFKFVDGKISNEDFEALKKDIAEYEGEEDTASGFRLYVEIDEVHRIDYAGNSNKVNMRNSFNLVIKL